MQHSLAILVGMILLSIGGCIGTSPAVPQTAASPAYATVAVDGTSTKWDMFGLLNADGVRVEKDANGDERIYDCPACRRLLVQFRRVQRQRLDLIAQNIANIDTTHGPNGEKVPYRRQFLVVDPSGAVQIKTDPSPFFLRYDAGNPDADQNGYVRYPNVDTSIETINAIQASRAYALAGAVLRHFDPSYVEIEPGEPVRSTH